jgi:hypothetical protein
MSDPTPTVWVVYCPAHRHYLVHASAGGTTWTNDGNKAREFVTKPAARKAAEKATWLDHDPHPWARQPWEWVDREEADG